MGTCQRHFKDVHRRKGADVRKGRLEVDDIYMSSAAKPLCYTVFQIFTL